MSVYEEKYWDLISKYLSNNITLDETDELLKWLDEDPDRSVLLNDLQRSWEKTQAYQTPEFNTDAAWQKVSDTLQLPEKTERRINWRPMLAAASLLIVFAFGWLFFQYQQGNQMIRVATADGERREIALPDGSHVFLNENSSLAYDAGIDNKEQRLVTLEGEGFFEVAKDPKHPFIITAGKTKTQVLGTSFNVKSDSTGDVKVAVFTGKVSFKPADRPNQGVILLPGDEAHYHKNGVVDKSTYSNANFLFWKNRKLEYNNTEVKTVLDDLSANYQVSFSVKDQDILHRRITSSFEGDSIPQVIDVLEALLDVRFTRRANTYTVEPVK